MSIALIPYCNVARRNSFPLAKGVQFPNAESHCCVYVDRALAVQKEKKKKEKKKEVNNILG